MQEVANHVLLVGLLTRLLMRGTSVDILLKRFIQREQLSSHSADTSTEVGHVAIRRPGWVLFLFGISHSSLHPWRIWSSICNHVHCKSLGDLRERLSVFSKKLVAASRKLCKKKGGTYLAHHDGLATGLSGLQFLATLLACNECRDSAWRFRAAAWQC